MPELITIYWRDIPAQVIGRAGRRKHRQELSPRFLAAIDRAAMRAGRGGSEAYLEDWRRERRSVEGDLEQAVAQRAEELESAFTDEQLERMVKAGGLAARSSNG